MGKVEATSVELPLVSSPSAAEVECSWDFVTSVTGMRATAVYNDGAKSAILSDESPRPSETSVAAWPSLFSLCKVAVEDGNGCGKGSLSASDLSVTTCSFSALFDMPQINRKVLLRRVGWEIVP
jgi:hypothetical protein